MSATDKIIAEAILIPNFIIDLSLTISDLLYFFDV